MEQDLFPTRKARSVKSRRSDIAAVIRARMAAGQPLVIREIIKDAGGGSTDTVREELSKVSEADVRIANALKGHRLRSRDDEVNALRVALDRALQRAVAAEAEAAALQKVVSETGGLITYLTSRHEDTFRQLVTAIDDNRLKTAEAEKILEMPPQTIIKEVTVEDLVLRRLYEVKVREVAARDRRINELEAEVAKLSPAPPPAVPEAIEDDGESVYERTDRRSNDSKYF